MVYRDNVLDILSKHKAIITDTHVVYTSGKHGDAYVNKDAIYPHTYDVSWLCSLLADHFKGGGFSKPYAVIAPAVGGVILSQWTAHHLKETLALYAEKAPDGESFIIKRGYDKLIKGRSILVVEDVLTTGGSVKKVVEAVRACNGSVIGVGALCNRGGIKAENIGNVPELYTLLDIPLTAYEEADCPLCKAGVPINIAVGKGREFLARKQEG